MFNKAETGALARHVLLLLGQDPSSSALDLGPPQDFSPENVMTGAQIYARSACGQCHGFDGRGGVEAFVVASNDDGTPARFPSLAEPVTWRGAASAKDVAMRIARGVPGTPMPAYRPALKDKEIWQLALYVETLGETTSLEALARKWAASQAKEDPVLRGRHLLRTLGCVYCHQSEGRGRGNLPLPVDVGPLGTFAAGPILPRSATPQGVSATSVLRAALQRGEGIDGRRLMPLVMPWPHAAAMPEADIQALVAALMDGPRPAEGGLTPRHASFFDQLTGKLSAAGALRVLEVKLGGPVPTEDGPHPELVALAVLLGALGVTLVGLLIAVGGPKRSRSKRMLVAFLPLPAGAALSFLMLWPAFDFRAEDDLREDMQAELPQPVGIQDGAIRGLALRGRDLVASAACAMCHTAQNPYTIRSTSPPLAGGMRMRSNRCGRVFARNLTMDPAPGIGGWSREELRRAIRGGVGRDGRVFHPDAMPYDLSGGLTDVELEAVITYLRATPAVPHRIPEPAPSDDLEGIGMSLFDYAE
jgi:mono/diheme cytochrome c family protein